MKNPTERTLQWEACYNVRDVGGYPIDGSGRTTWGALVRADTLTRLTPAGCQSLIDYGVRTIIDMRSTLEVDNDPNPFAEGAFSEYNVNFYHLPFISEDDDGAQAVLEAAGSQAEHYCLMVDRCSANIAAIVRAVARAGSGGVLVHCYAGKDRTGVMIAVLLALAGVSRGTIADDYALSEAQLRPLYDRLYPIITDPVEKERALEWYHARPETILAVLTHLDWRHGGVEAYLRAADVTEADIALVRERLREPGQVFYYMRRGDAGSRP